MGSVAPTSSSWRDTSGTLTRLSSPCGQPPTTATGVEMLLPFWSWMNICRGTLPYSRRRRKRREESHPRSHSLTTSCELPSSQHHLYHCITSPFQFKSNQFDLNSF